MSYIKFNKKYWMNVSSTVSLILHLSVSLLINNKFSLAMTIKVPLMVGMVSMQVALVREKEHFLQGIRDWTTPDQNIPAVIEILGSSCSGGHVICSTFPPGPCRW